MPKKIKVSLCILGAILTLFIVGELVYTKIVVPRKATQIVQMSEQKNKEIRSSKDSPHLSLYSPSPMPVMMDASKQKEYDQYYFWIVAVAEDSKGNNILDEKHLKYTPVDWTKVGTQTITYTLTDDDGHYTIKKLEVELTCSSDACVQEK